MEVIFMPLNLADSINVVFDEKAHTVRVMNTFALMCQKGNDTVFNKQGKLIIFTHSAQIRGMLCEHNDQSAGSYIAKTLQDVSDKIKNELPNNFTPINQCHVLTLKDVTITPFAAPHISTSIQFMQVFADQIVGVSVG